MIYITDAWQCALDSKSHWDSKWRVWKVLEPKLVMGLQLATNKYVWRNTEYRFIIQICAEHLIGNPKTSWINCCFHIRWKLCKHLLSFFCATAFYLGSDVWYFYIKLTGAQSILGNLIIFLYHKYRSSTLEKVWHDFDK